MQLCGLQYLSGFILLLCLLNLAESNSLEQSPEHSNSSDILETWVKLDKGLKGTVQKLIKQLMPMVLEASEKVNLTARCTQDSLQLISGLRNLKLWAFSFVDSSAKGIDGALSGTVTNLGIYDQCIETVAPHPRKKDEILFRGQYCRVRLTPPLPPTDKRYRLFDSIEELRNFSGSEVMKFLAERAHVFYSIPYSVGVCIPSSCTEDDLSQILNVATGDFKIETEVLHCEVKEEHKEFLGIHIFAIFICSLLAFLALVGTWIELHSDRENEKKIHRILRCFSVISNFKRIASTKSTTENFRCVFGIRFLGMMWVIFGHSYAYPATTLYYYRTLFDVQKIVAEPFAQTIINSSIAVDTFLYLSGFLVCYLTVKLVKYEKKRLNIMHFIIHRLWRLVPAYYFILLVTLLVPLMGSGPIHHEMFETTFDLCYQQWWKNLLFINNFFGIYNVCMVHNWYVACDIQLYLASLLVIIPLLKSEKIGIVINFAIIIFSIIYTAIVMHYIDPGFTLTMMYITREDLDLGFQYTYGSPFTRAGPYFIGVLVGYIYVTKPNLKFPKLIQVAGWCLAFASSAGVVYATALWFNVRLPSKLEILMYASLYNVAFTVGVAWMTLCCFTGQGGFINRILSWKAWVPLSKLTFLMYLIQPSFETAYISVFRSAQEWTHLHFIMNAFGFICISALLAFLVLLLVESPFVAIEKLVLYKKPRVVKDLENGKEIGLSNGTNSVQNNGSLHHIESSMDNKAFDSKL